MLPSGLAAPVREAPKPVWYPESTCTGELKEVPANVVNARSCPGWRSPGAVTEIGNPPEYGGVNRARFAVSSEIDGAGTGVAALLLIAARHVRCAEIGSVAAIESVLDGRPTLTDSSTPANACGTELPSRPMSTNG